MRLQKVNEHLKEKLKDPYFKELYELEEQKLNIVKRIVSYRVKRGLSQRDLARQVGVSQQHISKIENGEFSNIATLEKVLLFIGLTVRMSVIPLRHNIKQRISRIAHPGKTQFA